MEPAGYTLALAKERAKSATESTLITLTRGLATELAAALTKVAFEVDKVQRVEIHCDPNNVTSAAIPRVLGFIHDATLRHRKITTYGNYLDSMIWSLLASEYPTSKHAAAEIEAYDAIGCRII